MTEPTNTLVIIPGDAISKAVQAYELPDDKIQIMKNYCEGLTIAGPDDKANYKLATQAFAKVKKTRTAIEAKRKELKEPALEFGRAVDAEAKRLTALIEPVEAALKAKIDVIDREKERIEQERRNNIHNEMCKVFKFQSGVYTIGNLLYSQQQVMDASHDSVAQIIREGLTEASRLEAEAAELARLRKIAEDAEKAKRDAENAKRDAEQPKQTPEPFNEGTPHRNMAAFDDPFSTIPPVVNTPKQEQTAPVFFNITGSSTTPIEQFRPGYIDGFNAAKQRIIEVLESPEKLTRAQWVDKIGRMKP